MMELVCCSIFVTIFAFYLCRTQADQNPAEPHHIGLRGVVNNAGLAVVPDFRCYFPASQARGCATSASPGRADNFAVRSHLGEALLFQQTWIFILCAIA